MMMSSRSQRLRPTGGRRSIPSSENTRRPHSADEHGYATDDAVTLFKDVRDEWFAEVEDAKEQLGRYKRVLSEEYQVELDSDGRSTGSQRKRLKVAEQQSLRAKSQLAALHAELDQSKQQLDTERQQRARARDNHERLQSQLDTIRDLLNPRQRQSLGGFLRNPVQEPASPPSPDHCASVTVAATPRSILKRTQELSGRNNIEKYTGRREYGIHPDLPAVTPEPINILDITADADEPSFMATSCFSECADYRDSERPNTAGSERENLYAEIPGAGMEQLISPSAPPLPAERMSTSPGCSYVDRVKPHEPKSPRPAAKSPKTPRSSKKTPGSAKSNKEPAAAGALSRPRRHFLKDVKDNARHKCKHCFEWIRIRAKHLKCTQCNLRFHEDCYAMLPAQCRPPIFGTKGASEREAPPMGSNLQAAVKTYSMDADADIRIPGVLYDCIQTIERRGNSVNALYRTNGNSGNIKSLLEKYFLYPACDKAAGPDGGLRRPNFQVVIDIHDVTGVLKLFLSNLDEPLTSFAGYADIIEACQIKNPSRKYQQICKTLSELPASFLFSLKAVRNHLVWVVEHTVCQMDEDCISRIFAPSLLRSPEGTMADLQDSDKQIQAVKSLIELPDEYWVTAEIEVTAHGYCPSASPVPHRKELKRQKSSSKAIGEFDSPRV